MAYLILLDRNGEFDRRELREPLVIGRALDCQISVRDILLSRHHCKLEPFDNRWIVTDLASRNGTRIGNETISRHVLRNGDLIRIGKIQIYFKAGDFLQPPTQPRTQTRPLDPIDASAGTVHGFQLFDMEEDSRRTGLPIPKPKPPDPASYRHPTIHAMLTQIASTSWDQILSEPEFDESAPPEILNRHKKILREKSNKTNPTPP